jgi:hypothetical protein
MGDKAAPRVQDSIESAENDRKVSGDELVD